MSNAATDSAHRHRFVALDSLRGLCACMVVLYHFHTTGRVSNLPVVRNAFLFVDFFFVLSGFVIARSYRHRIATVFPIGRFLGLRLGRIYPLHLFMVGVFMLPQLALLAGGTGRAFQGDMSLPALAASLSFTQLFLLPHKLVWNGPSWSIAAEMWTYVAFALLFRLLRAPAALVAGCAALALVSAGLIAATQPRYIDAEQWAAFARCILGFALGVIGAELLGGRTKRGGPATMAGTLGEIAALVATVIVVSAVGAGPWSLAAPLLFLLVVAIFAAERGGVSRLLRAPALVGIGTLSYSIYLIHYFVLFRVSTALGLAERFAHVRLDLICGDTVRCAAAGSPLLGDALLAPVLALVIALSWCTWRFVELPGQAWSKACLLGRRRGGEQASEEQEAPAF